MSVTDWSAFWKKPNTAFNRVMQVSTDFFYNELTKRYPLKPGDNVLDYGCGPGFLVRHFVASGAVVTGTDINQSFLHQNEASFPGMDFIHISEDPGVTFRNLPQRFAGKQFDRIILLSIVQYFGSAQEVEKVVDFLKDYLKPDGKFIIADVLDEHTSSARDAMGIFVQCVRRGRVISFARFILYLMMSDYGKVSKKNDLLLIPPDVVTQMAVNCLLSVKEEQGMTPHPTRTNYILTHKR